MSKGSIISIDDDSDDSIQMISPAGLKRKPPNNRPSLASSSKRPRTSVVDGPSQQTPAPQRAQASTSQAARVPAQAGAPRSSLSGSGTARLSAGHQKPSQSLSPLPEAASSLAPHASDPGPSQPVPQAPKQQTKQATRTVEVTYISSGEDDESAPMSTSRAPALARRQPRQVMRPNISRPTPAKPPTMIKAPIIIDLVSSSSDEEGEILDSTSSGVDETMPVSALKPSEKVFADAELGKSLNAASTSRIDPTPQRSEVVWAVSRPPQQNPQIVSPTRSGALRAPLSPIAGQTRPTSFRNEQDDSEDSASTRNTSPSALKPSEPESSRSPAPVLSSTALRHTSTTKDHLQSPKTPGVPSRMRAHASVSMSISPMTSGTPARHTPSRRQVSVLPEPSVVRGDQRTRDPATPRSSSSSLSPLQRNGPSAVAKGKQRAVDTTRSTSSPDPIDRFAPSTTLPPLKAVKEMSDDEMDVDPPSPDPDDSDIDTEAAVQAMDAVTKAFRTDLSIASSSQSGSIALQAKLPANGIRAEDPRSPIQANAPARRAKFASFDASLLESPPASVSGAPPASRSPEHQVTYRRPVARKRTSPQKLFEVPVPETSAAADAPLVYAQGPDQESVIPSAKTLRSILPPLELPSAPAQDSVPPESSVANPTESEARPPTWGDLRKYLFGLLRYCQRFVPSRPHREYETLPPKLKRDPDWADRYSYMIKEATPKEWASPDILIVNEVDPEKQPCPPFEFLWTNEMLLGAHVPVAKAPTKGCECIGKCDPYSSKCYCMRRQRQWYPMGGALQGSDLGTLYDENGHLLHYEYPVIECNDDCECDEDCRNRVVGNGRKVGLTLKKTRHKGWGLFVNEAVPAGTFIGIYAGEVIGMEESDARGIIYENLLGRTYQFALADWHIQELSIAKRDRLFAAPRRGGRRNPNDDVEANHPIKYVVDAFWVGNHTRFINHSCDPNSKIVSVYINETDIEKPYLCAFTTKRLRAGTELEFDYSPAAEGMRGKRDEAGVHMKCYCGTKKCRGLLFT